MEQKKFHNQKSNLQFNRVTSLTRSFPKKLDFLIVSSIILGFMNILRIFLLCHLFNKEFLVYREQAGLMSVWCKSPAQKLARGPSRGGGA